MLQLIEFSSYVAEGGYKWRKDRRRKLWLVPTELGRENMRFRQIFPAEESLFLKFGALGREDILGALAPETEPEAFVGFANAHGTLGIAKEVSLPGLGKVNAESFEDWGVEVFQMHRHLEGWHVATHGTLDEINAFLKNFGEVKAQVLTVNRRGGQVYGNLKFDFIPEHAPQHEKREVARRNLIKIGAANMTDQLSENASFRPIYYDEGQGGIEPRVHPHNLLGFMWSQLLFAEAGFAEYRTCDYCGSSFLVDTEAGHRRSRRYCKNACKSAAYRKRKEQVARKPRRSTTRGKRVASGR